MKKISLIFALALIVCSACKEDSIELFNDVARVQMSEQEEMNYSFVLLPETIKQDTVWLPVRIIGGATNYKRYVKLSQITEYTEEVVKDENGVVLEIIKKEVENKAIAGVHYVSFDDAELQKEMYVKEGAVEAQIPIVLLRDKSLLDADIRLCVQLNVSDDFHLGEEAYRSRTIIFSDQLTQPKWWDAWTSLYFGAYSRTKHRFMVEVLGMQLDDDFYALADGEKYYLRDKCAKALLEFNSDPANIASGKAPLREDSSDPTSALITFPMR